MKYDWWIYILIWKVIVLQIHMIMIILYKNFVNIKILEETIVPSSSAK